LLLAAFRQGNILFLIGTIVFVATILLLYLGSMLYHAWPHTRAKSVLQLLDHSAIFWLIAGTYTPFALGPLRGVWGWTMLGIVWALAAFGVFIKATRGAARHRKLAMTLYLGMGWLALVFIRPLVLAAFRAALAPGWRSRLHNGCVILREHAAALRSFYLAPVRPDRYELSLWGRANLRALIVAG
jgi:channel protein (hemolysin III family)